MEEQNYLAQSWSLFKVVAPWITGGLAGAILTLIARRKEEKRRRKLLAIDTNYIKYALPESNGDNSFKSADLKISYKGKEYPHLTLYSCKAQNVGPLIIQNQNIVFTLPLGANIIEKMVFCSPIELAYNEDHKTTASGTEYKISFDRLEKEDNVTISMLLDTFDVENIKCLPRGVDDVVYQVGQIKQQSSIESDIYKVLLYTSLFMIGNGVPFFGGAIQAIIFIFMIPSLRRLLSYFIESRRLRVSSADVGMIKASDGSTINITNKF